MGLVPVHRYVSFPPSIPDMDSNLLAETSRIIAVHHEDVPDAASFHPDGSNPLATNSLAHVATTLITLKSSEAIRQDQEDLRKGVVAAREFCYLTVHGNAWDSAVCEVEHKRKSGKVAREVNSEETKVVFRELVNEDKTNESSGG